jgi:2,4-dienoyl-CoA reductase-like NADH-dependent reductase (Old Yellow Enzyme family)
MSALGDPFQLTESIRLRNRFVAAAHASGAVIDGVPTAGDARYWGRLAAGGAAMAITGGAAVALDATVRRRNQTAGWRPEVNPALRRRAAAIHAGGAVAIFQLTHRGRETLGAESYYAPVAPSAVRSPREPTAPRALRDGELDALVESFAVTAANALRAGFDGVELHAAHGYLLAQFLSSAANRRPGADALAGRVAPLWRIVDAVRDRSDHAVIGIRLSLGDEHDAGLSEAQLEELLAALHPEIQYVNLTVGMRGRYVRDMATVRPPLLELLPRLRAMTDLPLLVSQGFRDQPAMDQAIADGADLVGLARGLIADPDLPRKILSGHPSRVRPCVACNEDCRAFDPVLLCSVNPELAPPGADLRPALPLVLHARAGKRLGPVAVVGAGPAGLEAALALARGDRRVVVWEGADSIGGNLSIAGAAPHRAGWLKLIDFYSAGLREAGVELRVGQAANQEALAEFPVVVIVTGAAEARPVAAAAGFAQTTSEALVAGPERLTGVEHAVVVDDGFGWWPSVGVLELAVAAGVRSVTIVTPGTGFATGIPSESWAQLVPRLRDLRIHVRPLSVLVHASDGVVQVRDASTGAIESIEAGAAIVVGERQPRDYAELLPPGSVVFVAGDAIVPRRVAHAIAEGRAVADEILRSVQAWPGD